MKNSRTLLVLAMLSLSLLQAASGPDRMNYQGVLRDADGVPQDGTFDIRFRFFDANTMGNEVLVDEHLAAGTGGVVVTGGLFNVALGGGDVMDGSGPGVLASIFDVFGQFEAVWLEIEVDGETLLPRVGVLSSAYAVNSRLFQGRDVNEFIDTTATPQTKTGLLTASGGVDFGPGTSDDLDSLDVTILTGGGNADFLHSHSSVDNAANADLLDSLDSSQFFRSDTDDTYTNGTLTIAAGTVLDVNGEMRLDGQLYLDHDGPDGSQAIYFYDGGNPTGESLSWDEAFDRFTLSNTLRVQNEGHLELTGDNVYLNAAGPDTTQAIYFYDGGEPLGESITWDDFSDQFWVSNTTEFAGSVHVDDDLAVDGVNITLGDGGPDQIQKIGFFDDGLSGNEFLIWNDPADRFRLSNDLYMNGALELQGTEIAMGTSGPDATQSIQFYNNGGAGTESIAWDDDQDRFEISDELALQGTLRTGSTGTEPVTYNTIGSGTPGSGDMTSFSDLYVTADLELGSQLYIGGSENLSWSPDNSSNFYFTDGVWIGDSVGDNLTVGGNRLLLAAGAPNPGPAEYLEFAGGEFTLSDDLDVVGTLTANSKNFVQNHPYDAGLEVVYTTLEGPEAGTFTRGSARLIDGIARVPLDESFAWVTHPDLGLTVSLTPRGAWADLFVVEVTTDELVVEATPDSPSDAAFDYLVIGLRVGYEEAPVVRPRRRDASLPEPQSLREQIAGRPDLAHYTPLARYRATAESVFGEPPIDLAAGDALRSAIGTDIEVASSNESHETATEPETEPMAVAQSPDTAETRDDTIRNAALGLAYEDDQGNLYARSFRPHSGGLDSVSTVQGEVTAGDVLAVNLEGRGVRRADLAEDVAVVGIATSEATIDNDGNTTVPFAVAGIVSCKVDATHGAIQPGDLLVSSPTPGHAMRQDAPLPGTVLGKALETLDDGTGMIRVLVVLR